MRFLTQEASLAHGLVPDAQPPHVEDAQPSQVEDAQPAQVDDDQPAQVDDAQPAQVDDDKPVAEQVQASHSNRHTSSTRAELSLMEACS